LDSPAIAQFFGPGNWLISKVRVSSLNRARDAIDLVAATVDAVGFVEHAIFGEDLVDGSAPTRGVVFTEDVVKIAGQQGRYAEFGSDYPYLPIGMTATGMTSVGLSPAKQQTIGRNNAIGLLPRLKA
jgi:hypothetical protein